MDLTFICPNKGDNRGKEKDRPQGYQGIVQKMKIKILDLQVKIIGG